MTDRIKGFLVTLENEIREDDSENFLNTLMMIKGVSLVKSYVSGSEDYMMYSKGYRDAQKEMWELLLKEKERPNQ